MSQACQFRVLPCGGRQQAKKSLCVRRPAQLISDVLQRLSWGLFEDGFHNTIQARWGLMTTTLLEGEHRATVTVINCHVQSSLVLRWWRWWWRWWWWWRRQWWSLWQWWSSSSLSLLLLRNAHPFLLVTSFHDRSHEHITTTLSSLSFLS